MMLILKMFYMMKTIGKLNKNQINKNIFVGKMKLFKERINIKRITTNSSPNGRTMTKIPTPIKMRIFCEKTNTDLAKT